MARGYLKILELSTEDLTSPLEMAREQGGPRTASTKDLSHVSEIIRDIQNKVTHKGKRKAYDDLTADERRRMGNYTSMGWAFERVIEAALRDVWSVYFRSRDRYQKPGELVLDGICGTPDWIDLQDWTVGEFKATWRSSRRSIEVDFWSWLCQIKAYCKLLATKSARLYVFFVNGDYRESGPQLKAYAIQFTDAEIEENWQMLLQHARTLKHGSN